MASDWRAVDALEASVLRGEPGALTPTACRHFLQLVREHGVRKPVAVARCGAALLRARALPEDEHWVVAEQTVVACLDSGDLPGAQAALGPLQDRFPLSLRVERLKGLCLEARGDWAGAEGVYDAMLSRSPGHEAASKRKAALLRAQGRLGDAASALCEHLGTHQGDLEAWAEAAEVYALLGRPSHAAFCVEELLAAAPGDARLHGQYAGLRAWAGGGEGLKVAGSHFCAQVELTGGLAAPPLWGLLTTAAAQRAAGPPGGGAAAHGEAAALAAARLRRLYSAPGVAPATARLASAAIDALLPAKGSKARAG